MVISNERKDRAVSAYLSGTSAKEAATAEGFSHYVLYRRLKERGIFPRGGFGANNSGPNHYAWKGGEHSHKKTGYILCWVPVAHWLRPMAKANGTIPKHRMVMAEALGRLLLDHESVHHIDGNRANNQLANLQLRSSAHGRGQAARCAACGSNNVIFEKL